MASFYIIDNYALQAKSITPQKFRKMRSFWGEGAQLRKTAAI